MSLRLYATLCFLCFGVAAYAVGVYGFMPLGANLHPEMRANFLTHASGIYLHVFASVLALVLGPLQFSSRLRSQRPQLHRWLGRIYLGVGVLIGGLAGLFMALHAFGGLTSKLGFGALALAWLFTGAIAYLAIRRRDLALHRRWMIRNFFLTLAAVTLRLYLPVSAIPAVGFESAYPLIAWICWVPNLLLAELLIRKEATPLR